MQSLTLFKRKAKGEAEVAQGTNVPKEMLEYLVLQRRILDGKEGPWKVWGTTEETQADDILGKMTRKRTGVGAVAT